MDDVASLLHQGLAAHQGGDWQTALALYRRALAIDQNCADATHLIGVIAYQTGDPFTAIDLIGRAISIDGGNAAFHSNLGEALRATGNLDGAAASCARALEIDPEFYGAYQNLGIIELGRHRPEAAEDAFNHVLGHDNRNAPAWFGLGLALEGQGRAGEATAAFARCLNCDPRHEEARQKLADAAAVLPANLPVPVEPSPFDAKAEPPVDPALRRAAALADLRAACRDGAVSYGGVATERLERITSLCDALLQSGRGATPQVLDALTAERLSDDPVLESSVLFQLSGDLYHLERLLHLLMHEGERRALGESHYVFCCVERQLALGRALTTRLPAFATHDLPRFYRWMVGEMRNRYYIRLRPHRPTVTAPMRIAIVVNRFAVAGHQPSRDAFDYARLLQDVFGRAVLLVNANLLPGTPLNGFVPPFLAGATDSVGARRAVSQNGHSVPVHAAQEPGLSEEKIRGLVEAIEDFDPDLVLSFGGPVPVADLFTGVRPTICLPAATSGRAGANPLFGSSLFCSLADIVLGHEEAGVEAGDPTANVPEEYRADIAARFRPFRFGASAASEIPALGRAAFGLPEEPFLFVVVGGRLDQEVDRAFVERLDRLLDLCPKAMVVFAGPMTTLPALLTGLRNGARMKMLGFVAEIRSLFRVAGAFLNPPRQGGGGSAAYALADGVPVVTLNRGEVAAVVGPGRTVDDLGAFVERAKRLCLDPAFHRAESDAARRRHGAIDPRHQSVDRLLAYGRELLERDRR